MKEALGVIMRFEGVLLIREELNLSIHGMSEETDVVCQWTLLGMPLAIVPQLIALDLRENGLDGSIPRELGMLADLQFMQFYGDNDTLSVTVYPEL
jgi:hypothetical protein